MNIAKAAQHPKNSIVACGIAHTLVLTSTGQLLAWGCGKYGQLGYGDLWDREEPVVVPGVYSVLAFATGNRHNIAAACRAFQRIDNIGWAKLGSKSR